MTVLLEYLDRAFSICGCLLFYSLLILDPILLSFGKDNLLCLIHLHSNFQLVPPCCGLCDIGGNSTVCNSTLQTVQNIARDNFNATFLYGILSISK